MLSVSKSVILIAALVRATTATTYNIVTEYAGPTFFDKWQFYNNFDNLTNGDAIFVSASVAASAKLAYVDPTTKHAIIKVDNTTQVPFNQKRNTVRISTNDRYGVGSLWTADIYHVPFGCSVWPAWWSQAPSWPTGGEIDTMEAVNLASTDQMGLHTLPGCTQVNPVQNPTSINNSTDCSHLANSNQGCLVTNPSIGPSTGQAFATNGGGVWVTEFAETGISIWFFPRPSVPSVLSSNSSTLDTSALGTPTANWPSTGCSMSQIFEPQNLIFDITLCGDFAGNPAIFSQTCKGICYNDFVIGPPSGYNNAYFEVASVRVYNGTGAAVKGNGTGTAAKGNGASRARLASFGKLTGIMVGLVAIVCLVC